MRLVQKHPAVHVCIGVVGKVVGPDSLQGDIALEVADRCHTASEPDLGHAATTELPHEQVAATPGAKLQDLPGVPGLRALGGVRAR